MVQGFFQNQSVTHIPCYTDLWGTVFSKEGQSEDFAMSSNRQEYEYSVSVTICFNFQINPREI